MKFDVFVSALKFQSCANIEVYVPECSYHISYCPHLARIRENSRTFEHKVCLVLLFGGVESLRMKLGALIRDNTGIVCNGEQLLSATEKVH